MTHCSIHPIILCGGSGTRLWPMSREDFPKQFVPLIQGKSLLEATLERIKQLGQAVCITNNDHRFQVLEAMEAAQVQGSMILEPAGRNTAAAIACAALNAAPEDLLLFLPADHYIPDTEAFVATVRKGAAAALAGHIVTFGVAPSFPSTAYGYIQRGKQLSGIGNDSSAFAVARFVEKPPAEQAAEFLMEGNYFWNAGIFLSQAGTLIDALRQHAPDILSACKDAMDGADQDGLFVRPETRAFLSCRSESIDYAVMEKFQQVAMLPFHSAWSDVGSWTAVAALSEADPQGNRVEGQGVVLRANETYINAPYRPVVALGTQDLLIIDTPDAVLVAHKTMAEQVKEAVAALKLRQAPQATSHRRVARPWGWYDSIDAGERFQVKRITVKPGAALSLQLHHHRAEHWIVVKGTAKVTRGDETFLVAENQSTYIPLGTRHRLENPGKTPLEMIEVQSGSYLGEDDIVRFEDAFGRC